MERALLRCLYFPTRPAGPERSAALRCHIVVRPSQRRSGEFLLLSPPADPRLCEGERRRFTHLIWNTTELQVTAKVLRAPQLPSGEVKMVDRLANSEANSKRIAVVEGCFGAAGQPLAIPGRVLIGEGVLTKLCRKKPKARQFFLFNDILVYGNIVIQKKKYNKQHIIPLESVTIDTVPDEGDLRNGWLIKTPTKSFAVYAATATEKSEWMNHIGKCVGDLLQKSGKAPTGEHAAVWVPDSEATVCMRCQKVKFTPVSRRHHCRKCGFVVCGPCSEKKYLLPSQSSKPVRVCEYCFVQLTSGGLAPRSDSISRPGSKFNSNNLSDDDDEDDSSD